MIRMLGALTASGFLALAAPPSFALNLTVEKTIVDCTPVNASGKFTCTYKISIGTDGGTFYGGVQLAEILNAPVVSVTSNDPLFTPKPISTGGSCEVEPKPNDATAKSELGHLKLGNVPMLTYWYCSTFHSTQQPPVIPISASLTQPYTLSYSIEVDTAAMKSNTLRNCVYLDWEDSDIKDPKDSPYSCVNHVPKCVDTNEPGWNLKFWAAFDGDLTARKGTGTGVPSGGAVPFVNHGSFGQGIQLKPSTSVAFAHDLSHNLGSGDFTIDAWVKAAAVAAPPAEISLLDKRSASAGGAAVKGWQLYLANGNVAFRFGDGVNAAAFVSAKTITDDQWRLVSVSVKRSAPATGTIYVDNSPVLTFDPIAVSGSVDSGAPLVSGRDQLTGNDAGHFKIDEIEIFARSLHEGKIKQLFDRPKCKWNPPPTSPTTLIVEKKLEEMGPFAWSKAPPTGPASKFDLIVQCPSLNGGIPQTIKLEHLESLTLNVLVGETCTLSESPQAIPPGLKSVCWWEHPKTVYRTGGSATTGSAILQIPSPPPIATIQVANTVHCLPLK